MSQPPVKGLARGATLVAVGWTFLWGRAGCTKITELTRDMVFRVN